MLLRCNNDPSADLSQGCNQKSISIWSHQNCYQNSFYIYILLLYDNYRLISGETSDTQSSLSPKHWMKERLVSGWGYSRVCAGEIDSAVRAEGWRLCICLIYSIVIIWRVKRLFRHWVMNMLFYIISSLHQRDEKVITIILSGVFQKGQYKQRLDQST